MTDEDDNARIARELAELGEPELEADVELALTSEAAVLAAFALAYPSVATSGPVGVAELPPLGELDRHRVWRRIAARSAQHHGHARPASSWRATWVAVAMAAGVALVPMLAPPSATSTTPTSRAATEALGVQARAALDGVPGTQDGARASELAAKYAARLDGGAEGER